MKAVLEINPYPKQVEFFKCTSQYVAYGGARGGGKSWAARTKATLLALNYSGMQILLLRRTLMELRENHAIPLQKTLKGIAEYKDSNKEFVFGNGSRIKLGYCSAERDVLQYQGQAYDAIFLEEATQFTEFQFTTLTESNRSSGLMEEKFTPRMYFTCNPGGIGHYWVKRLFIDKQYRNQEKEEDYYFIQSLVYDNEFIMVNNPEYVKKLENLPEMRKKQMLYGDWNAFEGQYFSEFQTKVHTCDTFVIPSNWKRYRTLDYGLDMLACYWIAVDTQGKSFIYKELYKSGLIISEAAKEITRINNGEEIIHTYAPPDLWNRRQETGKSASEIFHQNGINLYKSKNARVNGWYALKEWLKPYTRRDEHTGDNKTVADMVIFKNCVNLIRCLPQLQCDEKNPNDVSNEPHNLTHGPDGIRYYASMRVSPTKIEVDKKNIFDEWEDKQEDMMNGEISESFINGG